MLEGFLLRLEELAAAVVGRVGLVGLVEGDRGTETAALLASPGLLVALGSVAGTPGGDAETARRGDEGLGLTGEAKKLVSCLEQGITV